MIGCSEFYYLKKKTENSVILSLGLGYPLGRQPCGFLFLGLALIISYVEPDTGLFSVIAMEVQVHGTHYPMITAPQMTHQMWDPNRGSTVYISMQGCQKGP